LVHYCSIFGAHSRPLRFRYYSTEGNNSSSADQTMELMQQLASAPGIVRSEQTLFLHRQQQQKEKEQQHKKAAISSITTTSTSTTTPVSSTSVWPKVEKFLAFGKKTFMYRNLTFLSKVLFQPKLK
jgi:hypothetical protein